MDRSEGLTIKVFAIWDDAAQSFLPPFYAPTANVAMRNFIAGARQPDHDFCRFPADYTLFELGEFNQDNGEFNNLEAKHNLGTALELRGEE